MEQKTFEQLKSLRKLPDDEAAVWIMAQFPLGSSWIPAMTYIRHLSWRKPTRKLLFEYYFVHQRWGNKNIYTAFLSIMPVREFIGLFEANVSVDKPYNEFLQYYLELVFTEMLTNDDCVWHPKTGEGDQTLIRTFLKRLPSLLWT